MITPTDDLYREAVLFVIKYFATGSAAYLLVLGAIKLMKGARRNGLRVLRMATGTKEAHSYREQRFRI